jgi:DinB superfamily
MDKEWNTRLADQLDWQWQNYLRPRLNGLTDEEYFWEPVAGSWNVRPRGTSDAPMALGSADYVLDHAYPEPEIPPVTTIAWRLAHLIVGVFGERNAWHFDGPPMTWHTFAYAGSADEALGQLDDAYADWIKGVHGLGEDGLWRPCGPAEGPFADSPLCDLVLHINREALHHGAEIGVLRDLYQWKDSDHHAV